MRADMKLDDIHLTKYVKILKIQNGVRCP